MPQQISSNTNKKASSDVNLSRLTSLLTAILALTLPYKPAIAAEKIVFSHGLAGQSVSLDELETFAETGEQSPAVAFIIQYAGHNPELIRLLLNQEIPLDAQTTSRLLNSPLGNYILYKASLIVNTGSATGSPEALRGALIRSAGDSQLSLIEVWRNYPTREVRVDSKSWNRLTAGFNKTLTRVGKTAELSLALLQDFLWGQN